MGGFIGLLIAIAIVVTAIQYWSETGNCDPNQLFGAEACKYEHTPTHDLLAAAVIFVLIACFGLAIWFWIEDAAKARSERRRQEKAAEKAATQRELKRLQREEHLSVAKRECRENSARPARTPFSYRRGDRDEMRGLLQHRCGRLYEQTQDGYVAWALDRPNNPYLDRTPLPTNRSRAPRFECSCTEVILESDLQPWDSATSKETTAYESVTGETQRAERVVEREREAERVRTIRAAEAERERLRRDAEKREHEAWLRSKERAAQIRRELAQDQPLRWRIFARDQHRCLICLRGGDQTDLTIDHIVPVSLGGDNDESNLRTLCRRCNSSKGATPYRGRSSHCRPSSVTPPPARQPDIVRCPHCQMQNRVPSHAEDVKCGRCRLRFQASRAQSPT
jgi:5-methylcytosine-specific restriction endonuclease McrA